MRDGPRAGPPDPPGLKLRLEARLGLLDDLVIVPYHGYGTCHFLNVRGRVLEKKGLMQPAASRLRHIFDTIQRFRSDEIPGARIRLRFGGDSWETWSDSEGFFQINVPCGDPVPPGWHTVHTDLLDSVRDHFTASARAQILVPPEDADFGIISDLDDTVIHTGANRLVTRLRTIFAQPAAQRVQLPGVATFYHALVAGPGGDGTNPVFYLSRSGWNLYEPFLEFFRHNDLPKGPLFLQDIALRENKSRTVGAEFHKLQQARMLLNTYPAMRFILVGDSGQGDPETYRQLVHEFPRRIRAIYIRDVTKPRRDREVEAIARELHDRGVAMLHSEDSASMAAHAAEHELIRDDAVADVEAAV